MSKLAVSRTLPSSAVAGLALALPLPNCPEQPESEFHETGGNALRLACCWFPVLMMLLLLPLSSGLPLHPP